MHRNPEAREFVVNSLNPETFPRLRRPSDAYWDETRGGGARTTGGTPLASPSATALLTMEVKSQTRLYGNGKLYSPVLSGHPLYERALQRWSASSKLDIKANASEIIASLQIWMPGSLMDAALTMRVSVGHLFLKSVDIKSLAKEFSYNAFVWPLSAIQSLLPNFMISAPFTTASLYSNLVSRC